MTTVPRSRTTSSAWYGRLTPRHRASVLQALRISLAAGAFIVDSFAWSLSIDFTVRDHGEKSCETGLSSQSFQEPCCRVVMTDGRTALLRRLLERAQLPVDALAHEFQGHTPPVLQHACRVMNPLPELCPRNLRRRRVFHEVVDRHAAEAPEPGGQILQPHAHIVEEP